MNVGAVFEDPISEDDGFVFDFPCAFNLAVDFFDLGSSGGDADFDSTPFDLAFGVGVDSTGTCCVVDTCEAVAFDHFDIEDEKAVVPAFFGAAEVTGVASGP